MDCFIETVKGYNKGYNKDYNKGSKVNNIFNYFVTDICLVFDYLLNGAICAHESYGAICAPNIFIRFSEVRENKRALLSFAFTHKTFSSYNLNIAFKKWFYLIFFFLKKLISVSVFENFQFAFISTTPRDISIIQITSF